jgi:hypothetical protein
VAGEQFHTDGGVDQINFERCRGDRDGFVVVEHFWTVSLSVADARRGVNNPELTAVNSAAARHYVALLFQTDRKREKKCSEQS